MGWTSSSCSFVGSVLLWNDFSYWRPDIPGPFQNFKFLRVLHLEKRVYIHYSIMDLVHLRYFSARTYGSSVPSSISNLWNLETFILKGDSYFVEPVTVCKMVQLRHLYISYYCFPRKNVQELHEDSSKLYNLRTLSAPCFSCIEDAELMLRKTPNLRELKCHFTGVRIHQFPLLDFPTQLETLDISCLDKDDPCHFPICISASNLKKLSLHGFRLDLQHLSNIAQLQNLQALELDLVEFDEGKWEVSNDEFPQLKVLKVERSGDFEEWTVSDDAFPNLERLFFSLCGKLKEIASCFGNISSLKYIQVEDCSKSVEKSAMDIRETQVEHYKNVDFKLEINDYRSRIRAEAMWKITP